MKYLSMMMIIFSLESKENLHPSDEDLKRMKGDENVTSQAREEMEDILTCLCCQDIMTNPICLEPCLHAFCHDCYASWEVVQRTCPKCRVKVTGKKKNVVINGILEAFFKAYPEKRPVLKVVDAIQQQKNARVQEFRFDYQRILDSLRFNRISPLMTKKKRRRRRKTKKR